MKVSLKGLPNKPRGSAWPPSVRAVRCPVIFSCGKCTGNSAGIYRESGNERDLYLQLLTSSYVIEHIVGTAFERKRKVQATVGLYAPNPLGYTRATMVMTIGCNSEKRS